MIWTLFSDDGLPQRLLHLAKMIERATSRQMQDEFDMSIAQWRVLAFICLSGPANASFIGEAAEADQAEISRAVKALKESGHVTREFEAGSRKTMIIAPTDYGRERFEKILAARRRYFASVTGRLTPGERRAFTGILTTIAEDVVSERNRNQNGK